MLPELYCSGRAQLHSSNIKAFAAAVVPGGSGATASALAMLHPNPLPLPDQSSGAKVEASGSGAPSDTNSCGTIQPHEDVHPAKKHEGTQRRKRKGKAYKGKDKGKGRGHRASKRKESKRKASKRKASKRKASKRKGIRMSCNGKSKKRCATGSTPSADTTPDTAGPADKFYYIRQTAPGQDPPN